MVWASVFSASWAFFSNSFKNTLIWVNLSFKDCTKLEVSFFTSYTPIQFNNKADKLFFNPDKSYFKEITSTLGSLFKVMKGKI